MNVTVKTILIAAATVMVVQLVPYGRSHTNPPVMREPVWDSPATRELAKKACFDCHSNDTAWPWYSRIAPVSWLVYWDVVEGRKELNFSDWRGGSRKSEQAGEIVKEVLEGEMPPMQYLITHPEARLDDRSKKLLVDGLSATAAGTVRR